MGRSQETFGKKDNEKKRAKKKTEKEERKVERQANAKAGQPLEEMFAYVDEDGNISSTPPDPKKKKIIKDEDIQIGVARRTDDDDADPVRTIDMAQGQKKSRLVAWTFLTPAQQATWRAERWATIH